MGVLASHATDRGRAIEAAVRPLAQRELVVPNSYRRGSHWIAYRLIEGPDDWYTDIPAWPASVVEQMMRTWNDCVEIIDQGVASLG